MIAKKTVYLGGYETLNSSIAGATYKVENSKIATIDKNGKLVGKKSGTTTVTVTNDIDGITVSYKVKVTVKQPTMQTLKQVKSLTKGKSYTFKVTTKNSFHEDVAWYTSNSQVATVNQNGKVTAKKAGSVYIVARCGYLIKVYKVTVRK